MDETMLETTIETTMDEDFEQAVMEESEAMAKIEAEKAAQKAQWKKQFDICLEFFHKTAALVSDIYEELPSKSKHWPSICLVPKGTASQVTYYGKPVNSLRVAMNWNWRAGLDKCSIPKYIQCVTKDLPFVKARPKDHPERSSPPIFGNMVALFDTDNKYHCIFGEKYDRSSKTWSWVENTPERVAYMLRERYMNMRRKQELQED